jgi:hypothetical protein
MFGVFAYPYIGEPSACEKITVAATAIGITASYLKLASNNNMPIKAAVFTCETAPVRVWQNGTTPTVDSGSPGSGQILQVGGNFTCFGPNACKNFLAIEQVSGSAGLLQAEYYY